MKKGYKQLKQQVGIGMLGATAGMIGSKMPGTTGAALTNTSTGLSTMAGPMATVTGAGMVIRSLDNLKPRRRRR